MARQHVGIQFQNNGRVYMYRVPESITAKIKPGYPVKVPGSIYDNNTRWAVVTSVHDEYQESKNIHYVEILEVAIPAKRSKKKDPLMDLPATIPNNKPASTNNCLYAML